jgi:hypothetical protein
VLFALSSGPWPVKPQHLQELAAKEQQDGSTADKAAAAEAQAQKQRQQQAANRQSGAGGPAVVEQVLTLNNELFMVPEALFRSVLSWVWSRVVQGLACWHRHWFRFYKPVPRTIVNSEDYCGAPDVTSCRIQLAQLCAGNLWLGQLPSVCFSLLHDTS